MPVQALRVLEEGGHSVRSSRVTVRLKDGREFARGRDTYKGTPREPLSRAELRRKFMLLTAGDAAAAQLFERLERMDRAPYFALA